MAQNGMPPEQLARLREKISRRFNLDEFRTLCADLDVNYDDLPGEGLVARIRELVSYCERRDCLSELFRCCEGQFPQEDWGEADTVHLFFNVPPLPPHTLVGRDELLAELRAQLMRGGAIAITALNGLPGVGKTTLAVMLAHDEQVRAHFTGGLLWAGLGQNPAVDDTLNQWADALSVNLSRVVETADRARRVQAAIAARVAQRGPLLLVIDDAWSLEHANALNLACDDCAVLLTTRDEVIARRFAPRQAARVEELPEDEAVRLLMNVGQVDNLSYADWSRLARAVGGLPLALMLAGGYVLDHVTFAAEARAAMTALGQAETWLGLVDNDRRLTLQDVIGLSLDALTEDARAAFAGLAAFAPKPATFSVDAAQTVTGAAAETLGKLARRNLLEKVTPERATLHPTLAAAAQQRAGERLPELRLGHARYYLEWANKDRNAWQRIEPELEQIRAAWEHLPPPKSGEGRGGDQSLVLNYVWAMGDFLKMRGLWRESLAWHQHGLEAARAIGQRQEEGTLLHNIAWRYDDLGERRRALDYYQQSLDVFREVGDREAESASLVGVGRIYNRLGDRRRALDYYEQALLIKREVGDRSGEAATLNNFGTVYDNLGDRRRALDHYEQALPILREVGNRAGEATTLNNIGMVFNALGDRRRALDYYEQALPILREVGDRVGESVTLFNIALIRQDEGNYAGAIRLLEQVVAIDEAIEHPDLARDRAALEEARRRLSAATPDDEPPDVETSGDENKAR